MFCPKCGALLKNRVLKNSQSEEFCTCGYSKKNKGETIIKETINKTTEEIFIHEAKNPLADYDHVCKKCGYNKAIVVQQDIAKTETWCRCEANRIELVCGKCGYRERLE